MLALPFILLTDGPQRVSHIGTLDFKRKRFKEYYPKAAVGYAKQVCDIEESDPFAE
jgi:hypothetical protein